MVVVIHSSPSCPSEEYVSALGVAGNDVYSDLCATCEAKRAAVKNARF